MLFTIFSTIFLEAASQGSAGWQDKKTCTGGIIKTQYETPYTSLTDAKHECKRGCDRDAKCKFSALDYNGPKKRCVLHTECDMVGGQEQYVYTRSTY